MPARDGAEAEEGPEPELPEDVNAAVAGGVTSALVDVGVVVDVDEVDVVDEVVVVDEVGVGSDVTEQQELKVCAVPGAAAVSGALPEAGTYEMRACTVSDAGEPMQEGGKLSVY